MESFLELMRTRRWALLVLSLLGVVVIGLANYFVEAAVRIDLWALLIVPISVVAWTYSLRFSLAFASFLGIVGTVSNGIAERFTVASATGEVVLLVASFLFAAVVVSYLAATLTRQTHLASFDALTETVNTTSFDEIVGRELARGKRYDRPTTVAFLDVDNFKKINDAHGHQVGDDALQCVATAMRQQVCGTDTVGRLGGDEFGILLPEASEQAARVVLDRIQTRVRELAAENIWPISVSIGATTVAGARSDVTVDEVIKHADDVMYRVKSATKDGVLIEAFE
jgi:diguanylate cyclase (GGDEF)-like protein